MAGGLAPLPQLEAKPTKPCAALDAPFDQAKALADFGFGSHPSQEEIARNYAEWCAACEYADPHGPLGPLAQAARYDPRQPEKGLERAGFDLMTGGVYL